MCGGWCEIQRTLLNATSMENVEIPRFGIEQALQQIQEIPATIQSVTGSMITSLQTCLEIPHHLIIENNIIK